jgi:AcrR family transcriptional regulator
MRRKAQAVATVERGEMAPGKGRKLLEASCRVFAEKGFEGASVDTIAREAGIAKGTVYLYYPSKEELYWATLRGGLEEMSRQVREAMEKAKTLRGKVRALVATKLAFFDSHRDFYKIYQAEFGPVRRPLYLHTDLRDLYLEHVRSLERMIDAAGKRGEIRKVPSETAAFVLADLTRGVIARRLFGWSKAAVEEEVDFLVDFVFLGLGRK